ncbi:MAG: DUF4255 domain-containing protein [Lachnospiraceae bacterium]|nr:DUF4255 domain-containing protein [Lachnospiraceae bacterium]
MADYTMIADVSEKMVELLQRELVPKHVSGKDGIALCSPANKNDVTLGLFLFDIRESEEIRRSSMVSDGMNKLQYPPIYLNLYYMITAYTTGDVRFRTISEERILGKVIQYFHDYPLISIDDIAPTDESGVDLRIEMLRLNVEQKSKIWNFPNVAYKTSIFYKVAPIAISSARSKEVTRVRRVEINVDAREG